MTLDSGLWQVQLALSEAWGLVGPWLQPLLDNAWLRTGVLLAVVYVTIRAIAAVYGGDIQNSKLGPIAIRPHQNRSLARDDIKLPKALLPMSVDGVRATAEIYYVYSDSRGHRRERLVHKIAHGTINVAPTGLPPIQATYTGQEITPAIGGLFTEDVLIPTPDLETPGDTILATPERVAEYVVERKVLEGWTEDDAATRISLHRDQIEMLASAREEFLVNAAQKLRKARNDGFWGRLAVRRLARQRPSVVGSYYVKFRLSRSPFFILTRHPDRDLKMTAWLTVLTSLFAMLMEAWPLRLDDPRQSHSTVAERSDAPVRAPMAASGP
jgi:hypothetical protein